MRKVDVACAKACESAVEVEVQQKCSMRRSRVAKW